MSSPRLFGEGSNLTRPEAVATTTATMGDFMVCPVGLATGFAPAWMGAIYRMAYEQARHALRPSWYERSQVVSLN